jgi:hypothetical protein
LDRLTREAMHRKDTCDGWFAQANPL